MAARLREISRRLGASVAPKLAAIVLAGGSGVRLGAGRNKAYLPLAGKTIVARSIAISKPGDLLDEWQAVARRLRAG